VIEDSHSEKNGVSDIDHIANVIQKKRLKPERNCAKICKTQVNIAAGEVESQAFSPGLTPLQT
jgi:hypothetical protein